jgi:hypothetical protein
MKGSTMSESTYQTADFDLVESAAAVLAEAPSEKLMLEDAVQVLVEANGGQDWTGYGLHSIINSVFEAFESSKRIPPQMMYNYARNGMIVPGFKGTRKYTPTESYNFVLKFCKKHLNK